MISHILDPSAELLKTYMPPFRGTWKVLPPHLVPDDVLQDSLNVALFSGVLKSRSGMLQFEDFVFESEVIGSYLATDVNNVKSVVASTARNAYRHFSVGTWVSMTGSVLLNGVLARMTSIQ